ncbi:tol-pal system protein YbgF [Orbaceae bacterium ESL0721]|nr:tol-pal system protein YbgF [Orbaceae bacterium ESL0721]
MYKRIFCLCLSLLFAGYGCAAGSSGELERTIQAQGHLLFESQQRINELQSEIDILRGQVERNSYQLNQAIERQKLIIQQITGDFSKTSSTNNNAKSKGTLTRQSEPSVRSSNLAGWSASGNEKNDYNLIMQYVANGKQDRDAITAFQKFLQAYPKSNYQANANYWLGQLNYRQGNKGEASSYFATVVKNFSTSSKAADSLYKIGLIFLEKGDKAKAKIIFQQVVSQYPNDKKAVEQSNKKLASL